MLRATAARDDGHDGAGDVSAARGDAAADAPRAPTVPMRGRVLEKGTRRPLAGVAVIVDGAAAAETDADGRFELRVPPGATACRSSRPVTTTPTSPSRRAAARPTRWCCSGWRRG